MSLNKDDSSYCAMSCDTTGPATVHLRGAAGSSVIPTAPPSPLMTALACSCCRTPLLVCMVGRPCQTRWSMYFFCDANFLKPVILQSHLGFQHVGVWQRQTNHLRRRWTLLREMHRSDVHIYKSLEVQGLSLPCCLSTTVVHAFLPHSLEWDVGTEKCLFHGKMW